MPLYNDIVQLDKQRKMNAVRYTEASIEIENDYLSQEEEYRARIGYLTKQEKLKGLYEKELRLNHLICRYKFTARASQYGLLTPVEIDAILETLKREIRKELDDYTDEYLHFYPGADLGSLPIYATGKAAINHIPRDDDSEKTLSTPAKWFKDNQSKEIDNLSNGKIFIGHGLAMSIIEKENEVLPLSKENKYLYRLAVGLHLIADDESREQRASEIRGFLTSALEDDKYTSKEDNKIVVDFIRAVVGNEDSKSIEDKQSFVLRAETK